MKDLLQHLRHERPKADFGRSRGEGPLRAYFVEEVAVIWGVGRPAALVAGLLFRPLYWAACWSVVLPVQIISRSLFRRSWVLVLQVFEGSVRLQRA
jgi:hypothetical protein